MNAVEVHPLTPRLRARGLRSTAARRDVLGVLVRANRPVTVSSIAEALDSPCDRVTVYRVLDDLERVGLVRRLPDVGGRTWFADADYASHDVGFWCVVCGTVAWLRARVAPLSPVDAAWVGAMDGAVVSMSGRCPDCAMSGQRGG
jgi:Fe2+ or Zn2+ uptake regulation protein